jgi:hypothetical protein
MQGWTLVSAINKTEMRYNMIYLASDSVAILYSLLIHFVTKSSNVMPFLFFLFLVFFSI